jgi:hypothetical protein
MNYSAKSSISTGMLPMTGIVWWLGPVWLILLAVSLIAAGSAVMFLTRRQKVRP